MSDIWIWGEHDGVLRDFFTWTRQVRENRNLQEFSYRDGDPLAEVMRHSGGDATHIAWMNSFRPTGLDAIERMVVEELCAKGLPAGKRRWGFKEIRYGIEDDVPERLLNLYPAGKIVHTVRHPFRTVESSLFAWHFDELESGDIDVIRRTYRHYLSRWIEAIAYFDMLRAAYPDRVLFSRAEHLAAERSTLLQFLGVAVDETKAERLGDMVNPGQRISLEENSEHLSLMRDLRPEFAEWLRPSAAVAGYDLSS